MAAAGVAGLSATPGARARLADVCQGPVQVRAGLDVDGDSVRSSGGEGVDEGVGRLDHQVDVERQAGRGANGLDHHRADGEVGHEVPVHHVHVDPVGAGLLHGADLLAEPGEVGGEDGGCDQVSRRRSRASLQPGGEEAVGVVEVGEAAQEAIRADQGARRLGSRLGRQQAEIPRSRRGGTRPPSRSPRAAGCRYCRRARLPVSRRRRRFGGSPSGSPPGAAGRRGAPASARRGSCAGCRGPSRARRPERGRRRPALRDREGVRIASCSQVVMFVSPSLRASRPTRRAGGRCGPLRRSRRRRRSPRRWRSSSFPVRRTRRGCARRASAPERPRRAAMPRPGW